jgi:hypothetical protein
VNQAGFSEDPTDQVNRFAIVVLALVVIFCALLVTLLAWGATAGSIDRISDFAGYLRDHNNRDAKLIITLGAAVLVLLMLTAIIVEVTPSPIAKMRLRTLKAGAGTITTAEIAARVESEVRSVPHVLACTATVAARGKRVDVVLDLHVDEGAHLADTADAACAATQAVIEHQIGIGLAQRPRARLHYRELRLRDEQRPPGALREPAMSTATPRAPSEPAPQATEEARDGRPGDTDTSEEAQA